MINKHTGFTLVEISIVLVIIGLILGAVFVGGQTLIANTKTTGTITLIKDLSGAISDFKSRYHYLPGDLPSATQDISGITAGDACNIAPSNGTIGNGLIEYSATPPSESSCVVKELVLAGFVKGSATGFESPFNLGSTPDVSLRAKTSAAVTTFPATVQNVIEISNIPLDAAQAIDNKIDDGNFGSGNVMAASGVDATHVMLDIGL